MQITNIFNNDAPTIYYETLRKELSILFIRNFQLIKSKLHDVFTKYKSKFSLTFDCWKADNQIEYMTITIHYINKDWKLISRLIDMKSLEEPHNAEYL